MSRRSQVSSLKRSLQIKDTMNCRSRFITLASLAK
jgi:hypothetical protein